MMNRPFYYFFFLIVLFTGCISDTNDVKDVSDQSLKEKQPSTHSNKPKQAPEFIIDNNVNKDTLLEYRSKDITLKEIRSDINDAQLKLKNNSFFEGENVLEYTATGGQIFLIQNNQTIIKAKDSIIITQLFQGDNILLSFLTDNKGVSIKNKAAFDFQNALVSTNESFFDVNAPHLIYFQPHNTTSNPILDFILLNTTLAPKGNKIEVSIDGAFIVNVEKWAAYSIDGLAPGEHVIRLRLVDNKLNPIEGPFNDSGDRIFYINKAS